MASRPPPSCLPTRHPPQSAAFNDHCAAGLIAAARARGVPIPEKLALVGYDDSHTASLPSAALTTIAQDAPTLAGAALDLTIRRTEDKNPEPSQVVVPITSWSGVRPPRRPDRYPRAGQRSWHSAARTSARPYPRSTTS
jgi:hypothetical protein